MALTERPTCRFQQVCAISRDLYLTTTYATGADWKYDVIARAVRLGFHSPLTDQVNRAMDAVERSLTQQRRWRGFTLDPTPRRQLPLEMTPQELADHEQRKHYRPATASADVLSLLAKMPWNGSTR